jgi:hypothetical protein
MSSHTKTQQKALATLRAILRHVATHVDNRVGNPPRRDVTRCGLDAWGVRAMTTA